MYINNLTGAVDGVFNILFSEKYAERKIFTLIYIVTFMRMTFKLIRGVFCLFVLVFVGL